MLDDIRATFKEHMAANGVNIEGMPIADGKMHNVPAVGKRRNNNRHAYYVLYADGTPAGIYGDHQLGIQGKWRGEGSCEVDISAIKEKAAEREEERRKLASEVANKSSRMFTFLKRLPLPHRHPYIVKKGIYATKMVRSAQSDLDAGIFKIYKGGLVIPMYKTSGDIVGLQSIYPNGKKYFSTGVDKVGSYHPITGTRWPASKVLFIAEGWATAATINQVTGVSVAAAFDAGNLMPVAKALRGRYPQARIIIAADIDHESTSGSIENPGVHFATLAAQEVGARVCYPILEVGSDFNDLLIEKGAEEVIKQLTRDK